MPEDQVTDTSQLNRPVYTLDPSATWDSENSAWLSTIYQTADGRALYFYAGDQPASGDGVGVTPSGDGFAGVWHVYSGPVVDPTSAQPADPMAAPALAPSSEASPSSEQSGSTPNASSGDSTPEPPHVEIDGDGNAEVVTPEGTEALPPGTVEQQDQGLVIPPDPNVGNGGTLSATPVPDEHPTPADTLKPGDVRVIGVGNDGYAHSFDTAIEELEALGRVQRAIQNALHAGCDETFLRDLVDQTIRDGDVPF